MDSKSTLYKSIETIPIFNYLKCCEGDLTYICRNNSKVKKEHIEAWKVINQEITGDGMTEDKTKMCHVLMLFEKRNNLTDILIYLALRHDEEIGAILRSYGFRYDKDTRERDLAQLKGEIKNLSGVIDEKLNELKEKAKEGEKIDMYENIAYIEKYMGIEIDMMKVPVKKLMAYKKVIQNGERKNNI